jgi:hypothetical protein
MQKWPTVSDRRVKVKVLTSTSWIGIAGVESEFILAGQFVL